MLEGTEPWSGSGEGCLHRTFFNLKKQDAERFADHWVILSAKYGFIDPDFSIPGSY
jgi:hypothetical protein